MYSAPRWTLTGSMPTFNVDYGPSRRPTPPLPAVQRLRRTAPVLFPHGLKRERAFRCKFDRRSLAALALRGVPTVRALRTGPAASVAPPEAATPTTPALVALLSFAARPEPTLNQAARSLRQLIHLFLRKQDRPQ